MTFFTASSGPGCSRACSGSRISPVYDPDLGDQTGYYNNLYGYAPYWMP